MGDEDEAELRDVGYRLGASMLNYAHAALAAGHAVSLSYELQDGDGKPAHFVLTCTTTPPERA